ncbi:MAG: hypothetical protein MUC81_10720 [Bacteroidia bacterium]|jgi:hypothetical protein|nr:hypothetical protein [Bacteroidia bacterium]
MTKPNHTSIQKCEHCDYWTDGNKAYCSSCGEILDLEFRKERASLEKKLKELPLFMEWFTLKRARNNPFYFILEKLIQGGQFILMIVVLIVTIILFLLPG